MHTLKKEDIPKFGSQKEIDAYTNGYAHGYDMGHNDGYSDGEKDTLDSNDNDNYAKGFKAGYCEAEEKFDNEIDCIDAAIRYVKHDKDVFFVQLKTLEDRCKWDDLLILFKHMTGQQIAEFVRKRGLQNVVV